MVPAAHTQTRRLARAEGPRSEEIAKLSARTPTLLVVITTLAIAAGVSSAATAPRSTASANAVGPPPFQCRASAVRASFASPPSTYEPTVAASSGCTDAATTNPGPHTTGPLQIGIAGAFVHGRRPREAPGAASLSSLTSVTVTGSHDRVTVASAQSEASYGCSGTTLQADSSSQVTGLTIDGKAIPLASPAQTGKISIGSDGSYIQLGALTPTGASLSRAAAIVHLVGTGDVVIAESVVTRSADPCAAAKGFLPALDACPTGSDYDPVSQDCAITQFTATPIVVGTPFETPIGGSVLAVAHARTTLPTTDCLGRAGLPYVLVASPRDGGLVEGTTGADRIVAIGASYTILGSGGNDCIAFGGGSDTIRDGNGRVRLFGGPGNAKIRVGNGRDTLKLGPGLNTVHVGNGRDVIRTGPGIAKIFAGNGRDRITTSLGLSFIRAGNGDNVIHGGPGHETIRVGNGNNAIRASTGSAQINAGSGNNRIVAGAGVQFIVAGHGRNVIRSGLGFDSIRATGPAAQVTCIDHARVAVNPAAAPFARAHRCTNVVTA